MKRHIKQLYAAMIFASVITFSFLPGCAMAADAETEVCKVASVKPDVPCVGMSTERMNKTQLGSYTTKVKMSKTISVFFWFESGIIDVDHLQCKATVSYYDYLEKKETTGKITEVKLFNKWKMYSSSASKDSSSSKKTTTYSNEPSVEGFSNEEDFYDYYYYDFFDYEDAADYYREHGGV